MEPDSRTFRTQALAGSSIATAEIARLELFATLARKEALGQIHLGITSRALGDFDSDIARDRITVEPLNAAVVSRFQAVVQHCYSRSPPVQIRTLDAIHLATAIIAGETEIVVTDKRFRTAAQSLNFSVFPPTLP